MSSDRSKKVGSCKQIRGSEPNKRPMAGRNSKVTAAMNQGRRFAKTPTRRG